MTSDLLNPQQQEAVEHVEGPLLVLAGAGSGKTRIVTSRIMRLLQLGVPAGEILAVTFTNKAAEEMRGRIFRLAGQTVLTCTFHSLCARLLRESIHPLGYPSQFSIYDEDDSEKVLKECLVALHVKLEKGEFKTLRGQISQAKNALSDPEQFRSEDPLFFQAYDLYQKKLQSYHALDFDDLLFLTARLLREHPSILSLYQKRWSFILIDEYQDTNAAQYSIVKLLAAEHGNVFAVGDPDQSIYSWRGANIQNILQFSQDFPGAKIIPLEQNYRSRSNILEAANALIQHNTSRLEKNLWSDRGEGEQIGLYRGSSDRDEVAFIIQQIRKLSRDSSLSDMVIFYRTNFQSRIFEDHFLREHIPYRIIGGLSFYQRKEIKDVLSWLKVTQTGRDAVAFVRTLNLPKRGIGAATVARLQEQADQRGIGVVDLCEELASGDLSMGLSQKQLTGIRDYIQLVTALRQMVAAHLPLHQVISEVIERSRYFDILKEDPDTYEEKRANLAELVTKASEWEAETPHPSLTQFLEELALKSSADESLAPLDSIRMMTLHNGKGLEFNVVFLVGMEEELFPHVNTLESAEALEEERRLCYVGMTRAKERLFLSCSSYRYLWGMPRSMRPSRFLREIPEELLHSYHTDASSSEEELAEGAVVLHKDLGRGVIQSIYQTSLGVTYDVFFPQQGKTHSLVARFAKLTRVS